MMRDDGDRFSGVSDRKGKAGADMERSHQVQGEGWGDQKHS